MLHLNAQTETNILKVTIWSELAPALPQTNKKKTIYITQNIKNYNSKNSENQPKTVCDLVGSGLN